jgi:hypothetical protein
MVVRAERDWLGRVLTAFQRGEIDRLTLVHEFSGTRYDRAVWAICCELNPVAYLSERTPMMETHLLTREEWDAVVRRCLLFLRTDLPYQWRREYIPPLTPGETILRMGSWFPPAHELFDDYSRHILEEHRRRLQAEGDPDVWPFIRRKDYEKAVMRFGKEDPKVKP